MSTEKEALARQKVIQKKQEQSEPGSQKDSGHGAALSAGDMAALQGMVGNTAVGQLGQVQRAPQDGNGQHVEQASQAAFQNIVQRTPSNGAPLTIQRKLEGTSNALAELGEGNVKQTRVLGKTITTYRSSWAKVLATVRDHEALETGVANKAQPSQKDRQSLLSSLGKIKNIAENWIKNNAEDVTELRGRRSIETEMVIEGNQAVERKNLIYQPRNGSQNKEMEDAKDEQNHKKMSAIQNLLVRVTREVQMITEDFNAWHQSNAQADSQMAVSNWNEDYAAGDQASSLDKVAYQGNRRGFYQPDTNRNSPDNSGGKAGIPEHDANLTGRALAMTRIDNLLTERLLARHNAQGGRANAAPAPPPRQPRRALPEGAIALPGMGNGIAPGLNQRRGPENMLIKTDIATHTRRQDGEQESTAGFFMDAARGQEMFGGYMENGNVLMSETQRRDGNVDNNKLAMDDPQLQRSLNKLQLLDAICAQVDRHEKNFFVGLNNQGQVNSVQGIDNDLAFGNRITDPLAQQRHLDPINQRGDMGETAWKGLPPIADEELAQAIESLTEEDITTAIRGLVSDEELAATIARVNKTKEHIANLRAAERLIPTGEWTTANDKLQEQNKDNSYIGQMKFLASRQVGSIIKEKMAPLIQGSNRIQDQTHKTALIKAVGEVMPRLIEEQQIHPAVLQDDANAQAWVNDYLDAMRGLFVETDGMGDAVEKALNELARRYPPRQQVAD